MPQLVSALCSPHGLQSLGVILLMSHAICSDWKAALDGYKSSVVCETLRTLRGSVAIILVACGFTPMRFTFIVDLLYVGTI